MPRILVVDDSPNRWEVFRRNMRETGMPYEARFRPGPAAVTDDDLAWAHVVMLDHDMCQHGVSPDGIISEPDDDAPCPTPRKSRGTNALNPLCGCPTGADLVHRMAALPHRPLAVVHTANTVAGPRMVAELSRAGFHVQRFPASRWGYFDWRVVLRNWGLP